MTPEVLYAAKGVGVAVFSGLTAAAAVFAETPVESVAFGAVTAVGLVALIVKLVTDHRAEKDLADRARAWIEYQDEVIAERDETIASLRAELEALRNRPAQEGTS